MTHHCSCCAGIFSNKNTC